MSQQEPLSQPPSLFDAETWTQLESYFEQLPHPAHLSIWGDEQASLGEQEAVRLGRGLAERFEQIQCTLYPRRANYPYYPVIGVMGLEEETQRDYNVRLIGLPAGYQITSLIAAIQAVAFRGATLEPKTRLRLRNLSQQTSIEVLTDAQDDVGALLAKTVFGLAVASPNIRAFLIMTDVFPEALVRYSVSYLPHTVINHTYHVSGALEETDLLRHIARALKG